MHPIAAQSLLAQRPSKAAPFFIVSILGHVLLVIVGLLANWLLSPRLIDLDQKPITATLVRLGKPRDEKLLPRKEEPPPPPVEEPAPVAVPEPVAAPPPVAVAIPGLDKKPSRPDKKEAESRKQLFAAFSKGAKQANPWEAEGAADGDPNGDAAKAEGERYYALISTAVRRNLNVPNVIPEAEQRTLKALLSMRISATGAASDVSVSKTSGNALFDDAIVTAVKKAAPFSPPPEHLRKLLQSGVTLSFTP